MKNETGIYYYGLKKSDGSGIEIKSTKFISNKEMDLYQQIEKFHQENIDAILISDLPPLPNEIENLTEEQKLELLFNKF